MTTSVATRFTLVSALVVTMGCHAAFAQNAPLPGAPFEVRDPLVAEAARIRGLIEAGQGQDAAEAVRDLARLAMDEIGFGVTNARLTSSPATGFGVFQPRPDAVYSIDEPVYAYVELYGFSLIAQPDGENALIFDVSFTLDTPDGRQMTEDMVPMGEIRLTSHSQPLDAFFHLTYSITGAEGDFVLRTRVVDRASGESAEFTLPLEFRAAHLDEEDKHR